ncbi:MAG: nucleoside triphosphate pyrophosphohydrolase [Clostridia bacterium]|nr:nucleoside triphosphate pyrophosphohydrolase [Clostridia bacterium]
MPSIQYDKLVRDKIPEVIAASGKRPVADLLPAQEIQAALERKLLEEVREYLDSRSIEEMADVLEVLRGIAFHRGVSWDEIERERMRKREERGGFEKGVRLLSVESR